MTIFTDLLRVDGARGDEAMLQDILVAFRTALGFPLSCIVLYNGTKVRILSVSDARGHTGLTPGPCPPDAEVFFQMLRDDEIPTIMNNTLKDPLARFLHWIHDAAIGASASIPIHTPSGQVIGAMCCFSPMPCDFQKRDIKVMTVLARIASNIIGLGADELPHMSALRKRIRNVISDARVNIHLQPIVELSTSDIRGYEALSRFDDGPGSPSPRTWFDDARSVGMQPLLECTAMAEAVELLKFLPNDTYLSVNASPQTVEIGAVADILQDGPPDRIVLDLTEHNDSDKLEDLQHSLAELRSMGVQIAIDNFGTGDLQLPTIERLNPDILKLDISLVKSINRYSASQDLTRAIVKFAEDINAVLIAVGIEHESERATLAELGVEFGQGFLLAKPDVPNSFGIGSES